jgi:hypothetical protein
MPDKTEFKQMSYPAFLAMTKEGNPGLAEIDGNVCLCLFTDSKMAQAFHADEDGRHGEQAARVYSFKTAAELIDYLRRNEWQFTEQGCHFVALNVQPSMPPVYATFRKLIADLAWTD